MNKVLDEKRMTSCCFTVAISAGSGLFSFPAELRHDIMVSFCRIVSVKGTQALTPNKCLFVFCDVSYYRDRDQVPRYNVLQAFDSSSSKVIEFNGLVCSRGCAV